MKPALLTGGSAGPLTLVEPPAEDVVVVVTAATFLVALPWIMQLMVQYTTELLRSLPNLIS